MVRLNDLIVTHENSLSAKICDDLVSFFDSKSEQHEVITQEGKPNFTQVNLTKNREEKKIIHNKLIQTVFKHRDEYYKYVHRDCLLYTSPSPRDQRGSRMPSSA